MQSLDDTLPGGGSLHDVIAQPAKTDKPGPLKSSWHLHHREAPPARPSQVIFYLDDEDGETVGQSKTLEHALIFLEALKKEGKRCTVRPYILSEETRQAEEQVRRAESNMQFAGPTRPVRDNPGDGPALFSRSLKTRDKNTRYVTSRQKK